MPVSNALSNLGNAENKTVTYTAGNESVKLSPAIIKNYLVSGDVGRVTDQEVTLFLNLCRFQHLNPFLREAYIVKYGNAPATIVTGKDALVKRAQKNERYEGFQAGVIVLKGNGEIENRIGSLVIEGEVLVGGWAKVFVKGYSCPVEISVSHNEYIGKKSNGEVNSQWTRMPATMIRKVAFVQALREAFPDDLSGMYSQEEMGVDPSALDETPVTPPDDIVEVSQDDFGAHDDPLS